MYAYARTMIAEVAVRTTPSARCYAPAPRAHSGRPARALTCGDGRNGASSSFTAIGPAPGPPPPCGVLNVLCRFMLYHVEAEVAQLHLPSSALRLAPSQ